MRAVAHRAMPIFRGLLVASQKRETIPQTSRAEAPRWGGMGWTHFLNLRTNRCKKPHLRTCKVPWNFSLCDVAVNSKYLKFLLPIRVF